ncbi:hypothetical protein [Paraliobacillus zengyii]|uniref:hypothetical protein n=1 Tax=Paraliobacillus zengyii TaxID=2213194 RepID=UPI000DD3F37A|nr:hypothetical protein [Paraliobacillus zengyii]
MAFGIKRKELMEWKTNVEQGNIAFLTHYWLDDRFPGCNTVTKVGCNNIESLIKWGKKYGLEASWIHNDPIHPHFDLFGMKQKEILTKEEQWKQIEHFNL